MATGQPVLVFGPGPECWAVPWSSARGSVRDFIGSYCRHRGIPVDCFYVKCNGQLTNTEDIVQYGAVYSLEPRLRGGKGGFGSMLRALGAQIEKTTNREACRDLSGRRLRDVNHEKAMAEWVKQQAEREAEKEQRRLERLQRKLVEPKHHFASPDYQQQCHEMAERLEDSVLKGMQAASSKMVSPEVSDSRKRPNEPEISGGIKSKKRKCFWMGMDGLEDAGSSDDGDSEEVPSTSGTSFHLPDGCADNTGKSAEFSSSCKDSVGVSVSEKLPVPTINSETVAPVEVCDELDKKQVLEKTEEMQVEREIGVEKEACVAGKEEETNIAQDRKDQTKEATEGNPEKVPLDKPEGSLTGNKYVQEPIDLLAFSSVEEMEVLGLDKLKLELMTLGLKCGGTLQERAARLFSVRGLAKEQIDPSLFAKPTKGKKKKNP
ncbi:replication stress response regulator SDE2-like [Vombatus ursinus]|uniref:Replication stress response regulator SDE2 n=1 Tax=Vombatus ursinus TaxID=29139 RepID=A0A4X2LGC6_VOMUR|nr:replication stress response regulator SDE2-like [Vombatus ursinus]XP_027727623.1 replication stress response regulator SDE2-like [Vombatus ursinus]